MGGFNGYGPGFDDVQLCDMVDMLNGWDDMAPSAELDLCGPEGLSDRRVMQRVDDSLEYVY